MSVCAVAQAADRHTYQFQFDEVPAVGPHGETVQLPGPIVQPNAMAVDSGEVYIADDIYHVAGVGISRIDRFDAETGAFTGQLDWPAGPATYSADGIAVGHSAGETQVYVSAYETQSGKTTSILAVFDQAGTLKTVWRGAETASGGFGGSSVAVDDSSALPGDWASGDVYVADRQHHVIDVYQPEAGSGETKPVAEIMDAAPGEPLGEPETVAVSSLNGDVAIVSDNRVHVLRPGAVPGQYEPVATLTRPGGGSFSGSLRIDANDGEGDIYVLDSIAQQIFEFDAADEYQGQITPQTVPDEWWGGEAAQPSVIAADPETHRVYVGTYDSNLPAPVFVFGPNIVLPDVATAAASKLRPTSATLNGTVDLDKGGVASCRFEWGTSATLGEAASCGKVEGEGKVPVSADLEDLQPGNTYYYRLSATNANGTNDESQLQQLTTPGPRTVEVSASEISATSATLNATINPDASATSYYFQYGRSTEYEAEIPLAPGDPLGAGTSEVPISHHIQGLAPDAIYHYRVVTISEVEVEPKVITQLEYASSDETFTTQVAGTGLILPDDRQWELVSPPDKHGATISAISEGLDQASVSGDIMTYIATLPTESEVAGNSNGAQTQILSTRGPTGWSTQDMTLPNGQPTGPTVGDGGEYQMFSEDLSLALVEPFGQYTSLGEDASPPATERTFYLRRDLTCPATPTGCYEPLVTGAPGYADVPTGTVFGGAPDAPAMSFLGGTPNLAHVVLASSVPLTTAGGGLYEWSSGGAPSAELRSVAILPKSEGGSAISSAELGVGGNTRNAISANGSRVVWTESARGLYLRDLQSDETIKLNAVQGGSGQGPSGPEFQFANQAGTKVFFTDTQRLTHDSHATTNEAELYECEIVEAAGGLECVLSDLTSGSDGRSANVQGDLVSADESGDRLYLVAGGVLSNGANDRHETAEAGADNLYMLHQDSASGEWEAPQLIGVLSREDAPDWSSELTHKTARSSPNGRYLAFMSNRPLTGYDNHDASSGKADEEVFLFDAASGRLVCASCNPSGALPHGLENRLDGFERMIDGNGTWPASSWLAANVPSWTPRTLFEANYQSRYLSDEGRLFFNSSDALVPQDINGTEDVYEYEPAGVGSCTTASSTFGERSGGCVSLISSGTSSGESAFLDASENGDDVFFLTAERLVAQDIDSAEDVYDAHVCSSRAPCFTAPVPAPACTTADACRAAPTPQPTAFGAPASATFSGAGNVSPAPPVTTVRAKKPTRAERLAGALRECRKRYRSHRAKRTTCERQARKRLGGKTPRKTKATSKRGGK